MENTVIADKDFEYIITMKSFFKDEFKSGQWNYLIPVDFIKWLKRNIFIKIRNACGFVCPFSEPCHGHKLFDYVQMLWDAMVFAVDEKKVYYRYFYFENLVFKDGKLHSWDAQPVEAVCLKHL